MAGSLLRDKDIQPALKRAMVTSQTKNLVKAGVVEGPDNEIFPKRLSEYKWSGTRDYSMALIIIAFYAYCIKSKQVPINTTMTLDGFGNGVTQPSTISYKLLESLKKGKGQNIKIHMKKADFNNAFETVLQIYSGLKNVGDDNDQKKHEKREEIYKQFINRAGKIKPWIINGGIIADLISKLSNGKISAQPSSLSEEEFLDSIMNGETNAKDVESLINNNKALANAADKDTGNTALMCAVNHGDLDIVEVLLKNGSDVNAKNKDGKTALMHSFFRDRDEIAQKLIDEGADIEIKDNTGRTISDHINQKGDHKFADIINLATRKRNNSKPETQNSKPNTPPSAAQKSTLPPPPPARKSTLPPPPPPATQKSTLKEESYYIKEQRLKEEEIQNLLKLYNEKIKDLKTKISTAHPRYGQETLQYELLQAIKSNNLEKIKEIIAKEKNIVNDRLDNERNTALHLAVLKQDLNLVKLLLDNGADPNIRNLDNSNLNFEVRYHRVPGGEPPTGSTAFGLAILMGAPNAIFKTIENYNYKPPVDKSLLFHLTKYEQYLATIHLNRSSH